MSFSYFIFSQYYTRSRVLSPIPSRIFVDRVTIFSLSPMQHLRWSLMWQKKGKSWELFLNVFTESFVLNPTLKHIDKFRLHVQNQQKNTSTTCQIYSQLSNIFRVNNKDTRTMSGASVVKFENISHYILLLLLLNSNK